jgi:hypothetical protein
MDYRSLGNEVVTLVVGAEKKVFTVHKKLLCDRSAFFSKGFNGQFKEAAEGRMELPNDTSAAFECFLTWLYWDQPLAMEILPSPFPQLPRTFAASQ